MICSKLYNEYGGIEHDYTRKRVLVHLEVLLTPQAPAEWTGREKLWNAVEEIEKTRYNKQNLYPQDSKAGGTDFSLTFFQNTLTEQHTLVIKGDIIYMMKQVKIVICSQYM